jgi:O6-methylguanine-DNA--protein-cysteine methyltransferase
MTVFATALTKGMFMLIDRLDTPIGEMLIVADEEGNQRAVDWRNHEIRMRRYLPTNRRESCRPGQWFIVSCHRVIGTNGSLTRYGGGVERKAWLLKHEAGGGRGPVR